MEDDQVSDAQWMDMVRAVDRANADERDQKIAVMAGLLG